MYLDMKKLNVSITLVCEWLLRSAFQQLDYILLHSISYYLVVENYDLNKNLHFPETIRYFWNQHLDYNRSWAIEKKMFER